MLHKLKLKNILLLLHVLTSLKGSKSKYTQFLPIGRKSILLELRHACIRSKNYVCFTSLFGICIKSLFKEKGIGASNLTHLIKKKKSGIKELLSSS